MGHEEGLSANIGMGAMHAMFLNYARYAGVRCSLLKPVTRTLSQMKPEVKYGVY